MITFGGFVPYSNNHPTLGTFGPHCGVTRSSSEKKATFGIHLFQIFENHDSISGLGFGSLF
jgi:hypothetical protein